MHYKTIVLELIQQQPELHEQLRASRTLLATMDAYALELKASHEEWMDRLSERWPGSDPSQFSSRSDGAGDSVPTGPFALRIAEGRNGAYVSRRGDELHPPAHAARVRASRGQALLPMFGPPPRQTVTARVPALRILPAITSPLCLQPRRGLPPPGYRRRRTLQAGTGAPSPLPA